MQFYSHSANLKQQSDSKVKTDNYTVKNKKFKSPDNQPSWQTSKSSNRDEYSAV